MQTFIGGTRNPPPPRQNFLSHGVSQAPHCLLFHEPPVTALSSFGFFFPVESPAPLEALIKMSSEVPAETPSAPQDLPERTQNPAGGEAAQADVSKSAAKKAAKQAEMALKKAEKATKGGKSDKGQSDKGQKPAGKGRQNPDKALIGIDVGKEEDFPGWYQQVLTKGDMLDYYDVSGCYILKVRAGKIQ